MFFSVISSVQCGLVEWVAAAHPFLTHIWPGASSAAPWMEPSGTQEPSWPGRASSPVAALPPPHLRCTAINLAAILQQWWPDSARKELPGSSCHGLPGPILGPPSCSGGRTSARQQSAEMATLPVVRRGSATLQPLRSAYASDYLLGYRQSDRR